MLIYLLIEENKYIMCTVHTGIKQLLKVIESRAHHHSSEASGGLRNPGPTTIVHKDVSFWRLKESRAHYHSSEASGG